MMVQFILKRANTFENKIISREIHFRRMILSFLMMMTSGFSGITGNWLDLDWWLHCFFIYVFQQRLISQWTGSMDQKMYWNRHRQKSSEESNSQMVFMPTNITTKITKNKYPNFNSKLSFEINSDFSFWFYVLTNFHLLDNFQLPYSKIGFNENRLLSRIWLDTMDGRTIGPD